MSKVTLTDSQLEQLKEQYCEIVVDSMDMECLLTIANDHLTNYMDSLSYKEIKEEIDNHDNGLFDELVDNVTNETFLDVNNNGGKY